FFFSSRRRHTRSKRDWSSDVCSSDLQSFFQSTPGVSFILAALVGAASWILIATLLRVQVSTTHAIVGAIIVQAIYLLGASSLEWTFLIWRILLPLAAGPFVALIGVYII